MMRVMSLLFLSFVSMAVSLQGEGRPAKVDFFDSMEWHEERNRSYVENFFSATLNGPALQAMLFFKEIYDKNNFFERPAAYEVKIPKVIHQIWIGPKTPPAI